MQNNIQEAKNPDILSAQIDLALPLLDSIGAACAMATFAKMFYDSATDEKSKEQSGRLMNKIRVGTIDLLKALKAYYDATQNKSPLVTTASILQSKAQPAIGKWETIKDRFISFIERNGISMEDVEEAIKVPEDQATTMHVWTYGISALKELHENMQVAWSFSQRIPKKQADHLLAQSSHAKFTRSLLFKDLADYAEACVGVEDDQSEPTVRLMYSWANAVIDSAEDAFKFAQHLENELTTVASELDKK